MTALTPVTHWAAQIRAAWQSSFDGIMECGRLLVAAKDQLDHGQWLQLIESELPFKANTAQRLMKISTDERLTNAAHAPFLPRSRETLYELTKLPTEIFEQKIADGTIHPEMQRSDITGIAKREARAIRERVLAGMQMALPKKKYGVIYADPEWQFEVYSRDTGMDRAADNHYPTSATDAICARPVADIAADDCVLFLWATVPMLPDALRVIEAWGFTYKSHCIWAKDRIGTGYWFRNQHELLLVATRGNIPAPAMGTQVASLVDAPVGKHSEKPDAFYELIEAYFPNLPKIELNARRARPGWDCWGNEAPEAAAPALALVSDPPESELDHPTLNTVSTGELTGAIHDDLPFPNQDGRPSVDGAPPNDQNGGASPILGWDVLEIPAFLRRTGVAA